MSIIRVSSRETSGPSGAGDRAGSGRNPRLDGRVQLAVPPNWRIERPRQAPCLCGCDKDVTR